MVDVQSQTTFRLLLVENKSPFDATVRFFSRYISPRGSKRREFLLGNIPSGEQRLFTSSDIPNGEEVSLHVQCAENDEDQWTTTSSTIYVTYTSSSLGKIKYLVKGTKQQPELRYDGVVEDAIKTLSPTLADHRKASAEVGKKPVPDVSSALQQKSRWMQCIVQNKTQFLIVHDPPAYFDSGRYEDPPTNIEPYDNMVFTVCNRDWAPTGTAGGASFRIILDGVAEYPFSVGWTDRYRGGTKAGVIASNYPKDGYLKASDGGNTIQSAQGFNAMVHEGGREVKFRFQITASPGRRTWFHITQNRV